MHDSRHLDRARDLARKEIMIDRLGPERARVQMDQGLKELLEKLKL